MAMERKFQIRWQNWSGLIFPNPETSWRSTLADKNDNNNIAGIKNERIDELCDLYDVTFDQKKRIEIIREMDNIVMNIVPMALAWYAPYHRILYWNKFGHPEYYFTLYEDDYDIFIYWWYEPELDNELQDSMKKDEPMDVGEVEIMYWPEYKKRVGYAIK
jgi:microcin C transport system substrate-binding protein